MAAGIRSAYRRSNTTRQGKTHTGGQAIMRFLVARLNVGDTTLKIKHFVDFFQRATAHLSSCAPDTIACDCGSKMALSRFYHHPKTITRLYICGECKAAERVAVCLAKRREQRISRFVATVTVISVAYLTARAFVPFAVHMITGGQADVNF